MKEELTVLITE